MAFAYIYMYITTSDHMMIHHFESNDVTYAIIVLVIVIEQNSLYLVVQSLN